MVSPLLKYRNKSDENHLLPSWAANDIGSLACHFVGGASASVRAEEHFNSALLEIDNQQQSHTDLSVFEQEPNQASGTYRVDIYINNELLDTRDVVFSMQKNAVGKESLQPCLSAKALAEIGVKIEAFPQLGDGECADLSAIPQASAEFRLSAQ